MISAWAKKLSKRIAVERQILSRLENQKWGLRPAVIAGNPKAIEEHDKLMFRAGLIERKIEQMTEWKEPK